ncbi:lysophospholipid acyltransferase family protein [Nocardioides sp. AX2bis]|uniref:lysophospholipid acyltransferase family protein n=1 Tax=Nocardioides sp. AX2bis TaxID=2653157 RepID=UPI0012F24468|nr:lysophospholipid acyltransferase family protein [Nocardioides sp. AX2bis]VXB80706.1 1-acyl-sn-glycerol-3-phosphate acyltransferase [Nocardioides sp. AX2bis]
MSVRKLQQRRGWAFAVIVVLVKPVLLVLTRRRWIDGENIPATGGCVVVVNHLSHVDPLTAAHLVYDHGRIPRYLAKSGLFRTRALGFFLRAAGQIPVERATSSAVGAYAAAVDAVRAGECVVVYPEGTITRDPDLWPMTGKSGAARIALTTGCPVVPVGQWGPQDLLAPYSHKPSLLPRTLVTMKVGRPLDLAHLADGPVTARRVALATDQVMDAITGLVADIRGEQPPAERYDLRRHRAEQTREDGAS